MTVTMSSASERKRRQLYRSELHGQLPFETRGMDDPVPTIDFSPSGNLDASYSLERADVDGDLLRSFCASYMFKAIIQVFSASWTTSSNIRMPGMVQQL